MTSTPQTPTPSVVRRALAPALRARLLGSGVVVVGVVVVLAAVLAWLLSLPVAVLTVVIGVCLVAVVVMLAVLVPRHWVLLLDDDGYRVRALRSAQARSARWSDVRDVRSATVDGTPCVVLRLRDGRTTTVPVGVLEGDSDELVAAVGAKLDRTHGYKRLR